MKEEYIDTTNPLHAKAYLAAASHVLSGWPQDWSAEELALALLATEEEKSHAYSQQAKISIWNPIKEIAASDDTNPYLKSDEMICDLAESFIDFLEENR